MHRVLLSTLRRWAEEPLLEFQIALWPQIKSLVDAEGESKLYSLLRIVQVELLGSGVRGFGQQSTFGGTGA